MSVIYYSIPASAIPASAIPASAIPASAIPASAIPASAIPASAIPASAIPASAIPASAIPISAMPAPVLHLSHMTIPTEFDEYTGRGDTVDEALKAALEKASKATEADDPIINYVIQRISGEKSKERAFIQVDILTKVS